MKNNNIIKAHTENKAGRITFYIFEITGLVLACILFIMGIVVAIVGRTFGGFVQNFVYAVMAILIFFGIGRIIDLLYVKTEQGCDCGCDCGCKDEKCDCENKKTENKTEE